MELLQGTQRVNVSDGLLRLQPANSSRPVAEILIPRPSPHVTTGGDLTGLMIEQLLVPSLPRPSTRLAFHAMLRNRMS